MNQATESLVELDKDCVRHRTGSLDPYNLRFVSNICRCRISSILIILRILWVTWAIFERNILWKLENNNDTFLCLKIISFWLNSRYTPLLEVNQATESLIVLDKDCNRHRTPYLDPNKLRFVSNICSCRIKSLLIILRILWVTWAIFEPNILWKLENNNDTFTIK